MLKATFRTRRPEGDAIYKSVRRHFRGPSKLKSTYSMPSGDAAQAATFVWFLLLFVPEVPIPVSVLIIFWIGVCFARVFYLCHYIEDTCVGGLVGTCATGVVFLVTQQ